MLVRLILPNTTDRTPFRILIFVVCNSCPWGLGRLNFCSDCYDRADGKVCMNEDHEIFSNTVFIGEKCKRANGYAEGVICDRRDCRKTLKGLYFRMYLVSLAIDFLADLDNADCCLCDGDDFDICLQCVMRGRGCRNSSHYLRWAVNPIDITRRRY
jgi:hypothetical protein